MELISILPRIFSMLRRTTSIPTPRPERSVTFSAVEKPAAKMRSKISRSSRFSSARIIPRSIAFLRIFAAFKPRPSSSIWMTMKPPWWKARSVIVPAAGLPAATRASGISMPWSAELRIMWTSGSLNSSTMLRSSSVSSPSSERTISFPCWRARSRTSRDIFWKVLRIGTIRSDIAVRWRSEVMPRSWPRQRERWALVIALSSGFCTTIDCAMTSSPTRSMRPSSLTVSTRTMPDPTAGAEACWLAAGFLAAGAAGAARAARTAAGPAEAGSLRAGSAWWNGVGASKMAADSASTAAATAAGACGVAGVCGAAGTGVTAAGEAAAGADEPAARRE